MQTQFIFYHKANHPAFFPLLTHIPRNNCGDAGHTCGRQVVFQTQEVEGAGFVGRQAARTDLG